MAASPYITEIKDWKLEANEEDSNRYFFQIKEVDAVSDGRASFVIGRKGSGKTAIAQHIAGLEAHDVFVRRLSFKNFPFNELYKHKDVKFTSSQYITLWKYIIYSAICQMMSLNEGIDPSATAALRNVFDIDFSQALSETISRITQQTAGLTIIKAGVSGGSTKTFFPNDTPWIDRVNALEQLIIDYIDDCNYYVLFDELDEDYRDIIVEDRKDQYFDLMGSLFKAVTHVRIALSRRSGVRPVVFLRDDIYELMDDPDSNKWDDIGVRLDWTASKLQELTAFRISRAIDANGKTLQFESSMKYIFTNFEIRHGARGRRSRTVFNHMLDRTLFRPRDIISYLREIAKILADTNEARATDGIVRKADQQYSQRFSKEFINEMYSVLPNVREIFDIFADIRKQTITVDEFRGKYDQARIAHPDMLSFETACRFLFHFSVIGNQPSQKNRQVFKYKENSARLNLNESFVIHRGLLKSLQIA